MVVRKYTLTKPKMICIHVPRLGLRPRFALASVPACLKKLKIYISSVLHAGVL